MRALRRSLPLALLLLACSREPAPVAPAGPPELKVVAAEADPAAPGTELYLEGQKAFIEGRFEDAADSYRRSLLQHRSARTYHAMGDALYAQQRFRDAAEAYREAVKLEPDKWFSWLRLGRSLIETGNSGEAVEAFRKAQALKPADGAAYRGEAEAHVWAKHYDRA
ncbi:MAG: tetratricopeptide repeat protein, partial [Myxococcales bacterium]